MGDLIAFRSQRPSGQARPSGAGAEILFFTGVRYQRMSEDPPSSNATPREPRQGGKGGGRRAPTTALRAVPLPRSAGEDSASVAAFSSPALAKRGGGGPRDSAVEGAGKLPST